MNTSSRGRIDVANELSRVETRELGQCEEIIARGLHTFVEVGTALLKIRDGRLYRIGFDTFEVYCQERWQMTKSRANQLVDAARVVENLATIVVTPSNEAQARPLTSLAPEQQREAWSYAVETAPNGKPTAADVKAVVNQLFPSRANGIIPGQTTFIAEDDDPEDAEPSPPPGFEPWMRFYNDQLTFFTSMDRRGGMGVLARQWSEGQRRRMVSALECFVESATEYINQVKEIDA
jgi:hypothetical protein